MNLECGMIACVAEPIEGMRVKGYQNDIRCGRCRGQTFRIRQQSHIAKHLSRPHSREFK